MFIMTMPAINHITDVIIICCVLLLQRSLLRIVCFKSVICLHMITECEVIANPLFIYPLRHYQYVNRTHDASFEKDSFMLGSTASHY